MDFSLTTLFVLPATNTLPTTGTTANLVANQFGVFNPSYVPTTTGTIASQPYIMVAQGRPQPLPGVGTKRSDRIYLKNIKQWYKVTAFQTAANQIIDIKTFSATCGEDVTISLRLKSFYIDAAYFNGLTKSFTITTPCCDCGTDPCTEVDVPTLIDRFVFLINRQTDINSVGQYIYAERIGNDANAYLRLNGKTLPSEPTSPDLTNYPFQYDRLYFWAFAYKGPETTQDYLVWDSCDPFAAVVREQESTYPRGTSLEVQQLEKNWNSNNTAPIAKRIFKDVNFNGGFLSQVVPGTFYDFYYLKFSRPVDNDWNPAFGQDEAVIICNPTGQNTATITMLVDFLGTPTDESGYSTTTTTTTAHTISTTTTTSTTDV